MGRPSRTYIALGSNLGDRLGFIELGLSRLRDVSVGMTLCCSPIYETEPWGMKDQPRFLNCVAEFVVEMDPWQLLDRLMKVESETGRNKSEPRWSARNLDLDILLFGTMIITGERLTIPHPGILQRRFMLVPLNDLTPELEIPGTNLTVQQALERCGDVCRVEYFSSSPI